MWVHPEHAYASPSALGERCDHCELHQGGLKQFNNKTTLTLQITQTLPKHKLGIQWVFLPP